MPSSMCTLGHLFQKNGHLYSWKNLYTDVHSNFINDNLKQETTHPKTDAWLNKLEYFILDNTTLY